MSLSGRMQRPLYHHAFSLPLCHQGSDLESQTPFPGKFNVGNLIRFQDAGSFPFSGTSPSAILLFLYTHKKRIGKRGEIPGSRHAVKGFSLVKEHIAIAVKIPYII